MERRKKEKKNVWVFMASSVWQWWILNRCDHAMAMQLTLAPRKMWYQTDVPPKSICSQHRTGGVNGVATRCAAPVVALQHRKAGIMQ